MSDGIYTALSGAIARNRQLEVVSHNLANADTDGYRAKRVSFSEVLAGEDVADRQVAMEGSRLDLSQGALQETGNPLDVAVTGRGFLQVQAGAGGEQASLTRNGNLRVDADRRLVTQSGHPVLNIDGLPIYVPGDAANIQIAPDGLIFDEIGVLDEIRLVDVQDPQALQASGDGLYTTAQQNLMPAQGASLEQGFVENANVNPVESMTEMIALHRHFDTMHQLMKTYRTMDQQAINKVGKSSG
ncbi:flagellar basal-body rod protein FlgF [Persicimonas caeni]|jgi:flagellar basal-body rod protein FlgF|uniref:Flagellar basal-body rod protein FlgF n=1 Tax=Persicimonas caeni TaxID=2292766 RepID=A0A4Y6PSP7_PERCE|nr:flagellar basal-body rod protein FlgF [Persicimonas caeni]QDG51354.1 flagellar basal-body rod protein FlgF [Persicimonas caeni]QED32575.1 flagellar basal-body rod protein FlgF [Persicimonas caeni]